MSQVDHQRKVPFVDLVSQSNELADDVMLRIESVIRRADFVFGPEVEEFEQQFAEYIGAAHCIGVGNGTEALHLSLRAVGVGAGDEVITVANTFAASAFAIAYTGATPVFIDITTDDYNMDPNLLADALSPRTKAIVPVHLYGQPAEMDAITEFAEKHGLPIVEDACQAHGASYRGRAAGTISNAGCFSFYPGKNLGAFGDGGAIVTNDDQLAEQLRLLRNYGQRVKNEHTMLGYNSRLDTVQAAVLLVKLPLLDQWNHQRREAAGWYDEFLNQKQAPVAIPNHKGHVHHVYHLYVIQHDQRDALMDGLHERGVACGIHYPNPICHAQPFRATRKVPHQAPVTTRVAQRICSLPMYPGLSRDDIEYVVDQLVEVSHQLV